VHCWSTDFGTPSSPTTHRPTHFQRGSDQSIGTVQKIAHEEMINGGQRSIKQPFITSDREQMGETHQIHRPAAPFAGHSTQDMASAEMKPTSIEFRWEAEENGSVRSCKRASPQQAATASFLASISP
ncbi:hypothetical protein ACLOJK_024093, partial [Asimina triloba]